MSCSGSGELAFRRACRVLGVSGKVILDTSLDPLEGARGYWLCGTNKIWLSPHAPYKIALHEVLHYLFPEEEHEQIYSWAHNIAYGRGSAKVVSEARRRSSEL